MATVGELVINLKAETVQMRRDLDAARAEVRRTADAIGKLQQQSERVFSVTGILKGAAAFGVANLSLSTVLGTMQRVGQAAADLTRSQQALAGSARMVGVDVDFANAVARKLQTSLQLSSRVANDAAAAAVSYAAKMGDVTQAQQVANVFLQAGAAKGLSFAESIEALNLTLKGQDEGLDKLFNQNPSVFYDEYARSVGTTASKLTEAENRLAIFTGAQRQAAAVGNAVGERLATDAGKLEAFAMQAENAEAKLGAFVNRYKGLAAIGAVQIGRNIGLFSDATPDQQRLGEIARLIDPMARRAAARPLEAPSIAKRIAELNAEANAIRARMRAADEQAKRDELNAQGQAALAAARTAYETQQRAIEEERKQAADAAAKQAQAFTDRLTEQAATLGMTATEKLRYDAASQQLTATQRREVNAALAAIEAYEAQAEAVKRLAEEATSAAPTVMQREFPFLPRDLTVRRGPVDPRDITPRIAPVQPQFSEAFTAQMQRARELQEQNDRTALAVQTAWQRAAANVQDTLADMFVAAGRNLSSLADIARSAIDMVARTAANIVSATLINSSGLGRLLAGAGAAAAVSPAGASLPAIQRHAGGPVDLSGVTRRVPAELFVPAPRMHQGGIAGLRDGEIPAILERGEMVLPKGAPLGAHRGGDVYQVTIQAVDARSFLELAASNSRGLTAIVADSARNSRAAGRLVRGR